MDLRKREGIASLSLDHLVHFINSHPETAVQEMQRLGLHAVAGGRHETWGTYNSLCYFGLTYLEFLAIEDRQRAAEVRDNGLIRQIAADLPENEGLSRIALRTGDIAGLASQLTSMGLTVTGPVPGSRTRSDGSVIRWQMLFAEGERERDGLPLPFFIQWGEGDDDRRQDLTDRGIIAQHPAGSLRMEYVACAVQQLEETAVRWQEWFGLEPGVPYTDCELNAACQALRCDGGDILLCSPLGEGIVAQTLAERGERPFLVRFSGKARSSAKHLVLGSFYQL
ncbi:VOC family protein [Brevibacillus sp. B_LB10_24]|uniref:VOC family protein n=1 Tax=Brevibacillus sp. B_LB10_24 TaxID=3380645 RepID=UPI0038B7BA72